MINDLITAEEETSVPEMLSLPDTFAEPTEQDTDVSPLSGTFTGERDYDENYTDVRLIGQMMTPERFQTEKRRQQGLEFTGGEKFQAFLQQENTVASAYYKYKDAPIAATDNDIEMLNNGWDPIEDLKSRGYKSPEVLLKFIDAEYPSELEWRLSNYNRELQNRQIVNSMTLGESLGAGFATALLDPLNYALIGAPMIKAGLLGRTAYGATIGATEAAAQEVILNTTQTERTLDEAFFNIGATAIFGGVLGGLAGKAPDYDFEKEMIRAEELTEEALKSGRHLTGDGALSADKVFTYNPDVDLKFQNDIRERVKNGDITEDYGNKLISDEAALNTQVKYGKGMRWLRAMSPMLYVSLSRSHAARVGIEWMTDSALMKNKHFKGIKSRMSLDTKISTVNSRIITQTHNAITKNYLEYVQSLGKGGRSLLVSDIGAIGKKDRMSLRQFKEAVTDAYEDGGVHSNPFVAQAAKDRHAIMGPEGYERALVEQGILTADNQKAINQWHQKMDDAMESADTAMRELEHAEALVESQTNISLLLDDALEKIEAIDVKMAKRQYAESTQKKMERDRMNLAEKARNLQRQMDEFGDAPTNVMIGRIRAKETRARTIIDDLGDAPTPTFKATLPYGSKWYMPRIFVATNVAKYEDEFIEAVVRDWRDQAKEHLKEAKTPKQVKAAEKRIAYLDGDEGTKAMHKQAREVMDTITRRAVPHLNIEFIGKTNVRKKHRSLRVRSQALRKVEVGGGKTIDFIEKDIMAITRGHITAMTPELVMKQEGFDMARIVDDINTDYRSMIDEQKALGTKKSEREIKKLIRERDGVLTRMEGLYQLLNNDYARPNNPTGSWNQARLALQQYNVMRMLGSMTISAITDLGNFISHVGLRNLQPAFRALGANIGDYLGEGLKNRSMNNKTMQNRAKKMGLIDELVLSSRLQALALSDDFGANMGSTAKFMHSRAREFSTATAMNHWNAGLKEMAVFGYMDGILGDAMKLRTAWDKVKKVDGNVWYDADGKVIKKPISDNRMAKYAQAGLDTDDMLQLGYHHGIDMQAKRGKVNGIRMADIENWVDDTGKELPIARTLMEVLKRQANMAIVTPGSGDLPLWMRTAVGGMIGQFKSFSFTAINRIMLPNLQRMAMGDASAVTGMVMQFGLATMVYNMKMWGMGREPDNSWKNLSGEMVMRSGYFGILADVNAISHKVSRGTVSLQGLLGEGDVSRYYSRSFAGDLVGPTFGTMTDAGRAFSTIFTEDFNKGDLSAMRRLMPYQNLYWTRRLLTEGENYLASRMGL